MIIRDVARAARFRPDKMGKADLVRGEHLFAGLNAFEPGQEHAPHTHCERDKLYVVLEGRGQLTLGDETTDVEAGDAAMAPAGVVHAMRNPGPQRLVTMIVMGPPPRKNSEQGEKTP